MNKRIEQAAREIANLCDDCLSKCCDRIACDNRGIYHGALKMAEWLLSHQWISVDEELPEEDENNKGYSIPVFVIGGHHKPQSAIYSFDDKEFMSSGILLSSTHWMQIPSLKGGEE